MNQQIIDSPDSIEVVTLNEEEENPVSHSLPVENLADSGSGSTSQPGDNDSLSNDLARDNDSHTTVSRDDDDEDDD